jgi:hypothetical protein
LELVDRIAWLHVKHRGTGNIMARLADERVAYFSHKNDNPRRLVVVRAFLPDEQDYVPEGLKGADKNRRVTAAAELVKVFAEWFEELGVFVGFDTGATNLTTKAGEGRVVGALAKLEDARNLANAVADELVVDCVEAGGLTGPEVELGEWSGMVALFERLVGLASQDGFDLTGPSGDSGFENVDAIFVIESAAGLGGHVDWREWEEGLALSVADGDLDGGKELVQLLGDVLGDNFGPSLGVFGVCEQREEDVLAKGVQVMQRWVGEVAEED